MAEEAFDAISGGRYLGVAQVMEHIGQSSFNGEIRTPQQLMSIPIAAGFLVVCFFLQISLVPLMPLA